MEMIRDAHHRWKAAIRLLVKHQPVEDKAPDSSDVEAPLAYRSRDRLLKNEEWSLYQRLQEAIGQFALVFPKMRACDVLVIASPSTNLDQAVRIDRKRIDFVLCDRQTTAPLWVVQIERWQQDQESFAPRDRELERAILAAGLTLIRVRSDRLPTAGQLRRKLEPMYSRRDEFFATVDDLLEPGLVNEPRPSLPR